MTERQKKLYVDVSRISGKGLFAGETIKKGHEIADIKGKDVFKINKKVSDVYGIPDGVAISRYHWIDPDAPFKYINHSCDPNMGIRGRKTLMALKNIKEGDELTLDYSIIEPDPRWEMPCHCKSPHCRKIIRSIELLPIEIFKKYDPYIPVHLKKMYEKFRM